MLQIRSWEKHGELVGMGRAAAPIFVDSSKNTRSARMRQLTINLKIREAVTNFPNILYMRSATATIRIAPRYHCKLL